MGEDTEPSLSVDEFVEYCRTQAGLLTGRVEEMTAEVAELLDDVDEEIAALQRRLDDRADEVDGPVRPQSAGGPSGSAVDVEELEAQGDDLETKQALAEATQARIAAYRDLAAGYADLAAELSSDVGDGREAMERVVRFEADADAPAYFDDRETVAEAAAASDASETG